MLRCLSSICSVDALSYSRPWIAHEDTQKLKNGWFDVGDFPPRLIHFVSVIEKLDLGDELTCLAYSSAIAAFFAAKLWCRRKWIVVLYPPLKPCGNDNKACGTRNFAFSVHHHQVS
jgi:hypothetical protein